MIIWTNFPLNLMRTAFAFDTLKLLLYTQLHDWQFFVYLTYSPSEMDNWDSCTFKRSYIGTWDLFEETPGRRWQKQSHVLSLQITEKHVVLLDKFYGHEQATFQCVREIGETIRDWFVVRSVGQNNGWWVVVAVVVVDRLNSAAVAL